MALVSPKISNEIEDSTTTIITYQQVEVNRKPDILRMENHKQPTLKAIKNHEKRATHLDSYLTYGIVNKKDEENWLEERSRTVLDEKNKRTNVRRYDQDGNRLPPEPLKNLPETGSVLEKIFSNDASCPYHFRRGREWMNYNFRPKEEWDALEQRKQLGDVVD